MSKILGSACKHMDGIAFIIACLFIGLLFSSNADLKRELNLEIRALKNELNEANEIAVSRLERLRKLDETLELMKDTVSTQNEAITTLTADVRKLSYPPPEFLRGKNGSK